MDWLDLLAVQGTLKSLLQHHSSKASVLWCSAFIVGVVYCDGKAVCVCVCVCVCVKCILDVQLVQLNVPKKGWGWQVHLYLEGGGT